MLIARRIVTPTLIVHVYHLQNQRRPRSCREQQLIKQVLGPLGQRSTPLFLLYMVIHSG